MRSCIAVKEHRPESSAPARGQPRAGLDATIPQGFVPGHAHAAPSPTHAPTLPHSLAPLKKKQGQNEHNEPLAYAIINDKSMAQKDFFLRHEGVQLLTWSSKEHGFGVVDRYLHCLLQKTCPAAALSGSKIIFYHPGSQLMDNDELPMKSRTIERLISETDHLAQRVPDYTRVSKLFFIHPRHEVSAPSPACAPTKLFCIPFHKEHNVGPRTVEMRDAAHIFSVAKD